MAKDALGHGSDGKGAHAGKVDALPVKDTPGAQGLRLFGDNDSGLYRSSKVPIEANLDKKVAKGTYDHAKATTLWGYHADRAAQAYAKQMPEAGKAWHQMFSPGDRRAAAQSWANSYKSDRGVK